MNAQSIIFGTKKNKSHTDMQVVPNNIKSPDMRNKCSAPSRTEPQRVSSTNAFTPSWSTRFNQ